VRAVAPVKTTRLPGCGLAAQQCCRAFAVGPLGGCGGDRRALAWSISDNFGPAVQQVLAGDPVQRAEADLPGPRIGGSVRSGPVGALWPIPDLPRRSGALIYLKGLGSVGSALLAEDLLMLVTDDASGRLSASAAQVDVALGGANLLELTLMNKVHLSGQWDRGKPGRIIVRDLSPAGDEVLDAALGIVSAHQGKKPSAVIRPLGKNLRRTLYERLALSGVIRARQGRILGVFVDSTLAQH